MAKSPNLKRDEQLLEWLEQRIVLGMFFPLLFAPLPSLIFYVRAPTSFLIHAFLVLTTNGFMIQSCFLFFDKVLMVVLTSLEVWTMSIRRGGCEISL